MDERDTRKNKDKSGNSMGDKPNKNKEHKGKDYWDRVADDVASGYRNEEDENNILNIDQEPGDHEPGDKNHE